MSTTFAKVCSIMLGGAIAVANSAAHAQTEESQTDSVAEQSLPEPREVLTELEAARLLQVEREVLRNLARSGQVPGQRIGEDWRFSRAALLGWLSGYRQGVASAEANAAKRNEHLASLAVLHPITERKAAAIVGRGLEQTSTAAQRVDVPAAGEPIGTAPEGRSASEVFLRDQRILLAPNEFTLDFGLFYTRNDDLVLGSVDTVPTLGIVEAESTGGVLVGRYSVGRDTELFATTSYQNEKVAIIANGQPVSSVSRSDFGDIAVGVRRTVVHEGPGSPDVILLVEGRLPTGTGAYGAGAGVTVVKSFDPAVLFGSINYRHTFNQDFADITQLRPKDRIDAEIGYAFALNDTLILNTSLLAAFNMGASFDDAVIRQNEIFNLRAGLTARLSKRLFVQPSVIYRLNGPGNGVAFSLNFPYTFGL